MLNRVPVCENHLAALYEALKRDDLKVVRKVEHLLTGEEKCVACSYMFIAQGGAKKAFKEFLVAEGFCTRA